MAENRNFQPVRGTQSLLGEDADRFHAVIGGVRSRPPPVRLQAGRSAGDRADRGVRPLDRRDHRCRLQGNVHVRGSRRRIRSRCGPNSPPASARAYLSEGWQQFAPLKVATHGPAFRYERPQKGRFRQFHQLDAEIIGAAEAAADVEMLSLRRPVAEGARHCGRRDAPAQHARRSAKRATRGATR